MVWIEMLPFLLLLIGSPEAVEFAECPCNAGEFCESNICKRCPPSYFISDNMHKKTVCVKWTTKSGQHVIVVENGSSTRDVVWGCDSGYEKREFSSGGEWDCRETTMTISTTSTTTLTPSTTPRNSDTTVKDGKSQDNEKHNAIAIAVSVSIFLVATVVILIIVVYKKCIKKTDKGLELLFLAVAQVLVKEEHKAFIHVLEDPSGKFNKNHKSSDLSTRLHSWANCNPKITHSQCIVNALSEKGIMLPQDLNATDTAMVTDSLTKAGQLNREFRIFCSKLCELDVEKSNELVNKLGVRVRADFDIMLKAYPNKIDVALSFCLAKWAFQFPYVHNNQKNWEALTRLKETLVNIELNDLVKKLDKLAQTVYTKMEIFNPPHNGAAPEQDRLIPN